MEERFIFVHSFKSFNIVVWFCVHGQKIMVVAVNDGGRVFTSWRVGKQS